MAGNAESDGGVAPEEIGRHWGGEFTRAETLFISMHTRPRRFEAGEGIFREGDREAYMAFVASGEVAIVKEGPFPSENIIALVSQGECFGEMSLVERRPRSASALARRDTILLVMSAENFDSLVESDPKLGVKILRKVARILSSRLRRATGKLVHVI